ncbi:19079_t:CDS:1, partial [Gigaspora margarita]
MNRVRTKKVKKATKKVGIRKRIAYKSSSQIQKEFAQPLTYNTSQDIRSQASLNSVNDDDYSDQNLQESFSEENRHVNNDFEC